MKYCFENMFSRVSVFLSMSINVWNVFIKKLKVEGYNFSQNNSYIYYLATFVPFWMVVSTAIVFINHTNQLPRPFTKAHIALEQKGLAIKKALISKLPSILPYRSDHRPDDVWKPEGVLEV